MSLESRTEEGEDVIDSRDIIARLDELKAERQDLVDAIDALGLNTAQLDLINWDKKHGALLKALTDLDAEGRGYAPDWTYGEPLIRDSYFATYAQELAEDTGMMKLDDVKWPYTCIDWDEAARELQQDYTSITYGSTEYWVRS
jgi:hypothetical protein